MHWVRNQADLKGGEGEGIRNLFPYGLKSGKKPAMFVGVVRGKDAEDAGKREQKRPMTRKSRHRPLKHLSSRKVSMKGGQKKPRERSTFLEHRKSGKGPYVAR